MKKSFKKEIRKTCFLKIDEIIEYVSKFYTLKIGDLIYTGTPAGVAKVNIGDNLEAFIGDQKLLRVPIR